MRPPERILIIGLSNAGDAVLMSPVIARLHRAYPKAEMTLAVGERAEPLFVGDPRIGRVVIMEEFQGLLGRLRLVGLVWRLRPTLLVDLRQTLLPVIWKPWRLWRYVWPVPAASHMRDRHVLRLRAQGSGLRALAEPIDGPPIWISPEASASIAQLLKRIPLKADRRIVVLCPGARSHIKRWAAERFAALADRLITDAQVEVVLTGSPEEAPIVREVMEAMSQRAHSLAGRTSLTQLAALMQRADAVVTNDSASLHLACAVGTPVVAIFGPTDPRKYGPTGLRDRVIRRRLFCSPCEQALFRFSRVCMRCVSVDEESEAARQILQKSSKFEVRSSKPDTPAPHR
ncbi:MAG: glycosyltransferase family 9 protein [Candidatus Omnitrophica bacterium]|nr:glycosyltransferase family 9 protein [Candidatus Omnitrophota bacterium]